MPLLSTTRKRSVKGLSTISLDDQIKLKAEARKDRHEQFKQWTAGLIIIVYLILLIASFLLSTWGSQVIIPEQLETIALIALGYYFAGSGGR